LARLVRLFRAPVFHDLLAMLHGLMSGMATLLWSLVFFVIFIYVVALVFRALFGPELVSGEVPIQDETTAAFYFQTVERSMLTTFRCSFGDCSTAGGTPIFESLGGAGTMAGLMLSCLIFVSTIGLFNIISAVFIERIMEYAQANSARKMHDRLQNKELWNKNVLKLIRAFCKHNQQSDMPAFEDTHDEAFNQLVFSRKVMDQAIAEDPDVIRIMEELDIDPRDCDGLSDLMDSDNDGHVHITELINGLKRLRGSSKRSDVVAVDLMVRTIQVKLDDLCWLVGDLEKKGCIGSAMKSIAGSDVPPVAVQPTTGVAGHSSGEECLPKLAKGNSRHWQLKSCFAGSTSSTA